MGWKYSVSAWVYVTRTGDYHWEYAYTGNNLPRAIVTVIRAKRRAGCVRFEWNG